MSAHLNLLPFILLLILPFSTAEIRSLSITSPTKPIIPIDEFGFTHIGCLELNVTNIHLSSHSNLTLSKLGFFLVTRNSWLHVLQQLEDSDISCALDSNLIKRVYTFNSLFPNQHAFSSIFIEKDSDQYTLVFSNCYANTNTNVQISMDVTSMMYNLDGKKYTRDYLSAGKTILPQVYFRLSIVYFGLCLYWIWTLYKTRLPVFWIHLFMLAVVILKALNLLFEAEDKSYIKRTGSAHGWDVVFYIFSFLKGISMFTLIVLIGAGWSFLKPFFQDREKKVLMILIPLQVVANIAQVVIDETSPFNQDLATWKQVFIFVDVICCCAVLLPIVWSITNLREAARADGKAVVNLKKLTLFRHYYIVVICYIFFTRVVVFALEIVTSYRYLWTSVVAAELVTLAFYVFTGYMFKPDAHNPYFAIDDDDDEEKAAIELLKLEDEFEL